MLRMLCASRVPYTVRTPSAWWRGACPASHVASGFLVPTSVFARGVCGCVSAHPGTSPPASGEVVRWCKLGIGYRCLSPSLPPPCSKEKRRAGSRSGERRGRATDVRLMVPTERTGVVGRGGRRRRHPGRPYVQ